MIFFAIILAARSNLRTGGASRASLIRLLQISYKYGIYSLFTGKCNFGVVPGGPVAPYF